MAGFGDIIAALKGGQPQPDAMPFGVGGPAEPMQSVEPIATPLIGHLAQKTMDVPRHLIDAATQATPGLRREDYTDNPDAPQPNRPLYDASNEATMALMGRGVATPTKGLGIFGGKMAAGADLRALEEAKSMAAGGKLPSQIRGDTGWARSPADHEWRFEIPDNKSALKYMPEKSDVLATGSAGSLMHHPELFKQYPQLQGAGMTVTRGPEASGLWSNNTAHVIAPTMQEGRSVGLHELQHGVQGIEGFSPGINPRYYAQQIEEGIRQNPALLKGYDFDAVKNQAHNLYSKTAGEVESRNVQHRMDFSPQQRAAEHPWMTQDTPYMEQYHFNPTTETVTALRDKALALKGNK